MRLDLEQLTGFWESAAGPRPLVVIGAGRWGRTLVSVAAAARRGTQHLALVARSNMADTEDWRKHSQGLEQLTISADLDAAIEALSTTPERPAVIVASRPSGHSPDVRECLARGLHTMVEKPLAADPEHVPELLRMAQARQCALALGVEYSLLPAFHYAARRLRAPLVSARLDWADPPSETRHGQVKRAHGEINALEDNLPHALSILRIFSAGSAGEALTAAELDAAGDRGMSVLKSGSARMIFSIDRAATRRVRRLQLDLADGGRVDVDFAEPIGRIELDRQPVEMPAEWTSMFSTLRLEIGAFMAHAGERRLTTPLTEGLEDYARVHAELLRALK